MAKERQSGALSTGRVLEILYVEDDAFCANALSRELDEFARTTVVGTIEDALAAVSMLIFDLIFCDLGLPGISGLDGVRALHRVTNCPIIILTGMDYGHGDELIAFKKEAAAAGADGYIVKGASATDIRCDLHFILARHHRLEAERLRVEIKG